MAGRAIACNKVVAGASQRWRAQAPRQRRVGRPLKPSPNRVAPCPHSPRPWRLMQAEGNSYQLLLHSGGTPHPPTNPPSLQARARARTPARPAAPGLPTVLCRVPRPPARRCAASPPPSRHASPQHGSLEPAAHSPNTLARPLPGHPLPPTRYTHCLNTLPAPCHQARSLAHSLRTLARRHLLRTGLCQPVGQLPPPAGASRQPDALHGRPWVRGSLVWPTPARPCPLRVLTPARTARTSLLIVY